MKKRQLPLLPRIVRRRLNWSVIPKWTQQSELCLAIIFICFVNSEVCSLCLHFSFTYFYHYDALISATYLFLFYRTFAHSTPLPNVLPWTMQHFSSYSLFRLLRPSGEELPSRRIQPVFTSIGRYSRIVESSDCVEIENVSESLQ